MVVLGFGSRGAQVGAQASLAQVGRVTGDLRHVHDDAVLSVKLMSDSCW